MTKEKTIKRETIQNDLGCKQQENNENETLIKPNGEKSSVNDPKLSKFNKNKKKKKEKKKNINNQKKPDKLNLNPGYSSVFKLLMYFLFTENIIICNKKNSAPYRVIEKIFCVRFMNLETHAKAYEDWDPHYKETLRSMFGKN